MTNKKRPVTYIDMDNTLYDMKTPYTKALKITPEIAYPQSQYGFFTNLELLPGAEKAMTKLSQDYDVWIATRPSFENPLCYTEKRVCIEKTLGLKWVKKLIIIPDKTLLKGDFLIDDNLWEGFEGKQLLFGSEKYPNWKSILKKFNI